MRRNNKLNLKNMLTFIMSIAIPMQTYASVVWGHTSKINRQAVQIYVYAVNGLVSLYNIKSVINYDSILIGKYVQASNKSSNE